LWRAHRPIAKRHDRTQDQADGFLMRIICPACETAYDVPDQVVSPGRALRCARCRSEWVAVEPEAEIPPFPRFRSEENTATPGYPDGPPERDPVGTPPLPGHVNVEPLPAMAEAGGARAAVIAGWLLSLVLLVTSAAAAVAWRQPIEKSWPPSVRAYALLGLE